MILKILNIGLSHIENGARPLYGRVKASFSSIIRPLYGCYKPDILLICKIFWGWGGVCIQKSVKKCPMNWGQSANKRSTILLQSSRKEVAPVLSEVWKGISRIGHTPTGSFSYFPAPLIGWPTIARIPADLHSSSDDPLAFLPPSPLAGGRA